MEKRIDGGGGGDGDGDEDEEKTIEKVQGKQRAKLRREQWRGPNNIYNFGSGGRWGGCVHYPSRFIHVNPNNESLICQCHIHSHL
jgi:hypothetical protein